MARGVHVKLFLKALTIFTRFSERKLPLISEKSDNSRTFSDEVGLKVYNLTASSVSSVARSPGRDVALL